jgi:hypothetical protein
MKLYNYYIVHYKAATHPKNTKLINNCHEFIIIYINLFFNEFFRVESWLKNLQGSPVCTPVQSIDFRQKQRLPIHMANLCQLIFGNQIFCVQLVQRVHGKLWWQIHRCISFIQTFLKKYIELAQERFCWDDEDIK